ncbi:hypothetical protein KAJ38_01010 [Candidatus Pacearchaeota archaeon]|nr:hypothetical protein [Candidatus Pacearchaeota archaeon]
MNNYEERMKRTSEEEYIEVSYPWNGGISPVEVPCRKDSIPLCIEDSKLVAVIKE